MTYNVVFLQLKIFFVLDEDVKDTGTYSIDKVAGHIETNVTFKYPTKDEPVLKNLSLTINAGNIALVGRSGSGKSTISNLLPHYG